MATFDLKKAVARIAYDYIGLGFPEWWKQYAKKLNLPDLKNVNSAQLLGAKYFMTIKVMYEGKIYELPNEPLVSISLTKTIIETATVGKHRKGSVIEYITTENNQITIKGVCFDIVNPERYPADQVSIINELFDIDDSLDIVENPFFELFGIRKLALKSKQLDEMQGQQGLQGYTITAISDQDFYADLNELETTQSNFLK